MGVAPSPGHCTPFPSLTEVHGWATHQRAGTHARQGDCAPVGLLPRLVFHRSVPKTRVWGLSYYRLSCGKQNRKNLLEVCWGD